MTATQAIVERALSRWRDADAVEELLALAGGVRDPLEAARDEFVARLHRDPGDVAATQALRLVLRALDRAAFSFGPQRANMVA